MQLEIRLGVGGVAAFAAKEALAVLGVTLRLMLHQRLAAKVGRIAPIALERVVTLMAYAVPSQVRFAHSLVVAHVAREATLEVGFMDTLMRSEVGNG